MKEISEELEDRRCKVCVTCGAIFEGGEFTILEGKPIIPCPECGAEQWGLRWITPDHDWMSGFKLRQERGTR